MSYKNMTLHLSVALSVACVEPFHALPVTGGPMDCSNAQVMTNLSDYPPELDIRCIIPTFAQTGNPTTSDSDELFYSQSTSPCAGLKCALDSFEAYIFNFGTENNCSGGGVSITHLTDNKCANIDTPGTKSVYASRTFTCQAATAPASWGKYSIQVVTPQSTSVGDILSATTQPDACYLAYGGEHQCMDPFSNGYVVYKSASATCTCGAVGNPADDISIYKNSDCKRNDLIFTMGTECQQSPQTIKSVQYLPDPTKLCIPTLDLSVASYDVHDEYKMCCKQAVAPR